jgi:hypothetical protein
MVMVFTPRSTIFHLYFGGQYYWLRKPEYLKKTTDLPQVRQTLSHNVVSSTPCHELDSNSSTLVVICVLWTNSSIFVLNFEQGNFSLMEKKFIQISTSKNYHVNDFDLILMHRFLCFRIKKRIKSWEEWKIGWWVK